MQLMYFVLFLTGTYGLVVVPTVCVQPYLLRREVGWHLYILYKSVYLPATVKFSILLSIVLLRHITVVSFLMNILDAVTCSVEVKLAFRGVPLTLMRETVSGSRFKIIGGVASVTYEVVWVMSGQHHCRELDPSTRQVNITRSPGHVNCFLCLRSVPRSLQWNVGVVWKWATYAISISVCGSLEQLKTWQL